MLMEYKHCKLAKNEATKEGYIPSIFARIGKKLVVRNSDQRWDKNWTVASVGKPVAVSQEQADQDRETYLKVKLDV